MQSFPNTKQAIRLDTDANRGSVAVYGLMFLVLVYIGRVQELIPGLNNLNIGKLVVLLGISLLIISPKSTGDKFTSHPQVKYLLWILLIALISIPFSAWPGGSFSFFAEGYAKTLVFFFLTAVIVRQVTDIEKVVLAVALSVLLLGISVLLAKTNIDGRYSTSSTYDPNDLALIMVTTLPLVYYYAKERTGVFKVALYLIVALMLFSCMKTISRGGFIGLIVVGFAILYKQKSNMKQFVTILAFATLLIGALAPESYWERMTTILNLHEDYNVTASSGRIDIWKRGIKMMVANPLLGVGLNAYSIAEGRMHDGTGKWSTAHNSFIQIGAELGVIALIFYLKIIMTSLQDMRKMRLHNPSGQPPQWIPDAIEVSFYGFISCAFFLSQAYSPLFLFLVALAIGARKIADANQAHESSGGVTGAEMVALSSPNVTK